jgi:hypothetical protein
VQPRHETGYLRDVSVLSFLWSGRKVGQKRKPASVTKSFKAPFRPSLYVQHLDGQHSSKRAEYQALTATEKVSIFESLVPDVNTLNAHLVDAGDQFLFDIDLTIVDTIIRKRFEDGLLLCCCEEPDVSLTWKSAVLQGAERTTKEGREP